MKFLVGFGICTLVTLALYLIQEYLLGFKIPEVLIGWWGCTGYYEGMNLYERTHTKNKR